MRKKLREERTNSIFRVKVKKVTYWGLWRLGLLVLGSSWDFSTGTDRPH